MKTLVLLLVLAGVALFAYRKIEDHRAYSAYEGFADSWAQEKRSIAEKYGDAGAVRHAFEEKPLRGNQGGAAMEAFRGTLYAVESREPASGDGVAFVVRQTILFDPPGATTGIDGAMFARYRHEATVRKTSDGWRVIAFEPTFLEMGEMRRRNCPAPRGRWRGEANILAAGRKLRPIGSARRPRLRTASDSGLPATGSARSPRPR